MIIRTLLRNCLILLSEEQAILMYLETSKDDLVSHDVSKCLPDWRT